MKKKMTKKLTLTRETVAALLPQVAGGATSLCPTVPCTWNCPTSPNICQSGKYPC
jgi:hypothetical protein